MDISSSDKGPAISLNIDALTPFVAADNNAVVIDSNSDFDNEDDDLIKRIKELGLQKNIMA
jgi:hypothetical protein